MEGQEVAGRMVLMEQEMIFQVKVQYMAVLVADVVELSLLLTRITLVKPGALLIHILQPAVAQVDLRALQQTAWLGQTVSVDMLVKAAAEGAVTLRVLVEKVVTAVVVARVLEEVAVD